jgi:uncharacterized OB-fold protein
MSANPGPPRPDPDDGTLMATFWQGVREHRILLQRCTQCEALQFPPRPFCARCLASALTWEPIDGIGTVWSWCRYFHVYDERFRDEVPYNVALIKLNAGPTLIASLVNLDGVDVTMDMPVEPVFDVRDPPHVVLRFQPRGRDQIR